MTGTAVILFNLGGPDSPEAVQPFLRNLFSDPAIIAAPAPVRWLLARLISSRRAPVARAIYAEMGGRSPILEQTRAQADALLAELRARAPESGWLVEIAMRYWHPFAGEAAARVGAFTPDRIVLLPLYPQYSTTTTGSSVIDWTRAASNAGLDAPTSLVCCYPDEPDFIAAIAEQTAEALTRARESLGSAVPIRLLMSAHGLPKRVIARGDPYQWQVERTAQALERALNERGVLDAVGGVEIVTCYQSRVGPLEWIGPATDAEVRRAGADGAGLVVVPVAFVSEHSETLVELDIEYRRLAAEAGAPCYERVPTAGTHDRFISALARMVIEIAGMSVPVRSGIGDGSRICPETCPQCAFGPGSQVS